MKANGAPEKLYLLQDNDLICYCMSNEDDVEYTRTDAFIEKATEWLNNFYNENTHSFLIDEDIEKFINYMKGE